MIARPSPEKPCPTFSESAHDADECKHCGWAEEAHVVEKPADLTPEMLVEIEKTLDALIHAGERATQRPALRALVRRAQAEEARRVWLSTLRAVRYLPAECADGDCGHASGEACAESNIEATKARDDKERGR